MSCPRSVDKIPFGLRIVAGIKGIPGVIAENVLLFFLDSYVSDLFDSTLGETSTVTGRFARDAGTLGVTSAGLWGASKIVSGRAGNAVFSPAVMNLLRGAGLVRERAGNAVIRAGVSNSLRGAAKFGGPIGVAIAIGLEYHVLYHEADAAQFEKLNEMLGYDSETNTYQPDLAISNIWKIRRAIRELEDQIELCADKWNEGQKSAKNTRLGNLRKLLEVHHRKFKNNAPELRRRGEEARQEAEQMAEDRRWYKFGAPVIWRSIKREVGDWFD
jgi:hypothetical protein